MPPKKASNYSKSLSSQENNPSVLNLEVPEDQLLSNLLKTSSNLAEKNPLKKSFADETKPYLKQTSRTSSMSSGLGGSSPKKRISPKKDEKSNLPKSVIKEKPSPSPAKGWKDLEGFTELRDLIISTEATPKDIGPVGYEVEFPTLGESLETPKASTINSLDQHVPPSFGQNLLQKNIDDSTRHKGKEEDELLVSEDKTIQYESQFPSLGTELDEQKANEVEFNPEILEAEKKVALENQKIEPVDITQYLAHEERAVKTAHGQDLDKKTHGDLLSLDLDLKSSNPELMQKILDKDIHLKHTELEPEHHVQTWDKSSLESQKGYHIPKETAVQYENHFPALGAETQASTIKPVETEFTPDILMAEEKFAVETEHPEFVERTVHHDEEERPTREFIVHTRINEEEVKKTSRNVKRALPHPEEADEDGLHIPKEQPYEVLVERDIDVSPRNSENNEIGQSLERIPVELIADFLDDEEFAVYTPTNRRIKLMGQMSVWGENSPNLSLSEIRKQPKNFTEAVEMFLAESIIPIRIPIEHLVEYLEKELIINTPTNRRIKEKGQLSLWGDNSPNLSQAEIEKQPRNFTEAVNYILATLPADIEETLASEIEQEGQIMEIKRQDQEEKFKGRVQRLKQDEQLEEIVQDQDLVNSSLQKSWDIIRTLETQGLRPSHEGYNLVTQNVGDVEETEGLLNKEEEQIKEGPLSKKPQEQDLQPIEENIVAEQDEGVSLRDVLSKDIKKIEKKEVKDSEMQTDSKGGEKSSLEHLGEEPTLAFSNQSQDLTLSAQRIDLIKEELNTLLNSPKETAFKEIEKNFKTVRDLEKSMMYGAAINILKKSIEMLETGQVRHEELDSHQLNKYLVECHCELASCYAQVSEFPDSVIHSRAALNLDSKNIKAIYHLGTGLMKSGDPLSGYEAMKEVKRWENPPTKDDYYMLTKIELEKFERNIEQEARKHDQLEPVTREFGFTKTPVEYIVDPKKASRKKETTSSNILADVGIFAGAAGVSGAASWFVSKDYLKLSEKKSLIYSLGVGALVGGISLAIFSHFRSKSNK